MKLKLIGEFGFFGVLLCYSCATAPKVDDHSEIKIEANDKSELPPVVILPSTSSSGLTNYTFNQKPEVSQWIKCSIAKNRGTVLTLHRFGAGFDPKLFCNGWTAQVFLKKGFQVVAVNRPSYVQSSGSEDLGGPQSLAAIKAGLEGSGAESQLVGIWGYDVGTIAAAYFAIKTPTVKWLILGGGIYDLEVAERSTESVPFKQAIQKVKASEGDLALERRSISWDFKGLTKTIALYHSKDDRFAASSQADAFMDQLRTAEFKVYSNNIAGGNHDLPWRDHMKIVDRAIDQVAPIEMSKK